MALVTLFTDAGFQPSTRHAAWAAWAKMNGETIRHSGLLKGKFDNSDIPEMRALCNGVAIVVKLFNVVPGSKIIAQTDCVAAIMALTGTGYKKKGARARIRTTVDAMADMLAKHQIIIEYRHVKGHKGNTTVRNAVNTWCDRECTRHLRAAAETGIA